jgi:hypothetical protein
MGALRPEHMMRILELTDSFNISRESVTIPLVTDFEAWMKDLRDQLGNMALSGIGKH